MSIYFEIRPVGQARTRRRRPRARLQRLVWRGGRSRVAPFDDPIMSVPGGELT
jgi:hypothetical protein